MVSIYDLHPCLWFQLMIYINFSNFLVIVLFSSFCLFLFSSYSLLHLPLFVSILFSLLSSAFLTWKQKKEEKERKTGRKERTKERRNERKRKKEEIKEK